MTLKGFKAAAGNQVHDGGLASFILTCSSYCQTVAAASGNGIVNRRLFDIAAQKPLEALFGADDIFFLAGNPGGGDTSFHN